MPNLEEKRVVGLKQVLRAVASGEASMVYLARDAQSQVTDPVIALCAQKDIPVTWVESMALLGKESGIAVGAAAAAAITSA